MLNYHPDSEPATPRALLIKIENDTDYPQLIATVVREAKPYAEGDNPLPQDGKNARGFRHTSWSSAAKDALYVEDLQVRAQMNKKEWRPYGTKAYFIDAHYIEARQAKMMVRTFDKIDSGLEKIERDFGRINEDHYADYLLRVATILKIKHFIFFPNGENSSLDQRFDVCTAPDLKWRIERLLRKAGKVDETVA